MTRGPQKQFDREEVLERAMELFWARGYEATGMSALLEEMGIGRQSLYDTFGDKHSLYLEALRHYFRTRIGPVIAQLRGPGSAIDNIRGAFTRLQTMATESDCRGCLVGNSLGELAHEDADVRETAAAYFQAVQEAMEHAIERGKAGGEITSPAPTPHLAMMLLGMGQGFALLGKLRPDTGQIARVLDSAISLLRPE